MPHAVGLNSCTAGLHLACVVLGLEPGDEIITTPMTFCATINAIVHAGAVPVLADVDRRTMNLDPNAVREAITPRTRAILPVHFAGRPCAMDELMAVARTHDLKVIEDCAHATETTYDQWNACVAEAACTPPRHDRGWGHGTRPVIYVDYGQISDYLDWLSVKAGRPYRLPTEAEWEYAAHGGANEADRSRVDGLDRANCNECVDGWDHKTFPVATLKPNGYGLYDMLGNVMEWTSSCWVEDYRPGREEDCSRRVRRGGSWYFNRYVSTPTYRYGALPDRVSYDVGFRVAVTLD